MIELYEREQFLQGRQSSKGNQLKWKRGDTWYKADYAGYEGLAEYVVSALLCESDLEKEEFVPYRTQQIRYGNRIWLGCASPGFLPEGSQLITLERLYKNAVGDSLYRSLYNINPVKERLRFLVEQTERLTGIEGFGIYMIKMITVDALFLNEDRHMHNIAVILSGDGHYHLCPYFDHGASLLSDTMVDYPMDPDQENLYQMIDRVQAKGISPDFEEQLDTAETLYGQQIRFSFTAKKVRELLSGEPCYSKDIKNRVERILLDRMRKYAHLFSWN